MTFVLDCSHYQGTINWPQVAADGCLAAYVKVTDGAGKVDPDWQANHAGATAAGIPVGPYHFAEGGDVGSEAGNFAGTWSAGWQLHPVLDYEVSSANAGWLGQFRASFRADTGYQNFRVYSTLSMLEGALDPAGWLDADTTIWVARFASVLGWNHPSAVLWQNTDSARVAGIVGNVDEDQFLNGWTPAVDIEGDDMAVTDPLPVQRPDGSVPTVGEALGNLYIGAFYGGPSTGGSSEYAQLAAIAAGQAAIAAALTNNRISTEEMQQLIDNAVAEHVRLGQNGVAPA